MQFALPTCCGNLKGAGNVTAAEVKSTDLCASVKAVLPASREELASSAALFLWDGTRNGCGGRSQACAGGKADDAQAHSVNDEACKQPGNGS